MCVPGLRVTLVGRGMAKLCQGGAGAARWINEALGLARGADGAKVDGQPARSTDIWCDEHSRRVTRACSGRRHSPERGDEKKKRASHLHSAVSAQRQLMSVQHPMPPSRGRSRGGVCLCPRASSGRRRVSRDPLPERGILAVRGIRRTGTWAREPSSATGKRQRW